MSLYQRVGEYVRMTPPTGIAFFHESRLGAWSLVIPAYDRAVPPFWHCSTTRGTVMVRDAACFDNCSGHATFMDDQPDWFHITVRYRSPRLLQQEVECDYLEGLCMVREFDSVVRVWVRWGGPGRFAAQVSDARFRRKVHGLLQGSDGDPFVEQMALDMEASVENLMRVVRSITEDAASAAPVSPVSPVSTDADHVRSAKKARR
jgi:hypothetical protein